MNGRERLFLSVASQLDRKAKLAAAFWGVRAAYLSGSAPFSALSLKAKKALRTKGNPAIRMNDLFKARPSELPIIKAKYPHLARFAREIDYPHDMWWSDSSVPVEAKPSTIRENWSSARSLALKAEAIDLGQDDEGDDSIVARNQEEREELIALIENQRATGEDQWNETYEIGDLHHERPWRCRFKNPYPVLESEASFSARGSNDDLDEIFGEEPKDPRSESLPWEKLRQWTADKFESYFLENGMKAMVPSGDFFISDDEKWAGHMFSVPLVTEEFTGRPIRGGFVTRARFFEERDRLMKGLDTDYCEMPVSRKFRHKTGPEIHAMGYVRDYRGWSEKQAPGNMELPPKTVVTNPAAPEKPRLKRGQKHVVISHRSDGSTFECAPSF